MHSDRLQTRLPRLAYGYGIFRVHASAVISPIVDGDGRDSDDVRSENHHLQPCGIVADDGSSLDRLCYAFFYIKGWTPCIIGLMMMIMMIGVDVNASTTCPRNCSILSPIPYPFGAKPGCGSPGFQLTNCSIPYPLWNLTLAGTVHPYYINSIGPNPNDSNPIPGNYGNGGTVVLLLNYSTSLPALCEFRPSVFNNFTTSNFYAFEDAELTFYNDHYLLLNCTGSLSSRPGSGVLTPSSTVCSKYLSYCNFSLDGICLDFVPDKELQLAATLSGFGCSILSRFIIADEDAPISTWISATQLAWGPVKFTDSCTSCEKSGGVCGYDVQDVSSFLCYCDDGMHSLSCHGGSGNTVKVGVGVAIAVLFLLICGVLAYFFRQRYFYYILFPKERLKLDGINQGTLELPYGMLAAATKSFRRKIGQGAFGKVYKGVLPDGSEVAVKVLDPSMSHTDEQFINEVATIGNIHHMNVARLVGFCFRRSKRILVYEYVSNGSLDQYIFRNRQDSSARVLTWKQRYDIALGIARGLSYMHEECRNCIIHCDIKPQNILLDETFCPKISYFGLAKLLSREESRVLTQARGTPGYVAPEFWSLGSGPLTFKFDVYSYGVVLLEIVRGRRCFDMFDPAVEEEDADLWSSVLLDKQIEDDANVEQAKTCTTVALWCIQDNPDLRPTMSTVVQYLQGGAKVPDTPPNPFTRMFQSKRNCQVQIHSSDLGFSSSADVVCRSFSELEGPRYSSLTF